MKHYPYHVGDFDKATRHLTRLERSIYRDLLDLYYSTETRLTLDRPALCRRILARTDEESTAVEQVLNEFFVETTTGWYQDRCEIVISEYKSNTSQKALAGKASAEAKRLKKQQETATAVERSLNSVATESQRLATNHEPMNHEPVNTSPIGDGDKPDEAGSVDDCPQQKIIAAYHAAIPSGRHVREWTPARGKNLRSRWREKPARQKIEWWERFFAYVAASDFLMGKTNSPGRKPFEVSLDWLVKAENMAKVIEGAYENEKVAA